MNRYVVPNLLKTCEILKLLARHQNGLLAKQIEQMTDTPKTTSFRILKTLCDADMVVKKDSLFFAGPGLYEIGLAALRDNKLRELSIEVLQDLTRETHLTSHLAIPTKKHSLILEVCDSPGPIRVASRPGTQAYMHNSATGKLFLSYLYKDCLKDKMSTLDLPKQTKFTITTVEGMEIETSKIISQKYAVDNEEYHPGVKCLAAPVFNLHGNIIAAIGVTGPANLVDFDTLPEIVIKAGNSLSAKLGFNIL